MGASSLENCFATHLALMRRIARVGLRGRVTREEYRLNRACRLARSLAQQSVRRSIVSAENTKLYANLRRPCQIVRNRLLESYGFCRYAMVQVATVLRRRRSAFQMHGSTEASTLARSRDGFTLSLQCKGCMKDSFVVVA